MDTMQQASWRDDPGLRWVEYACVMAVVVLALALVLFSVSESMGTVVDSIGAAVDTPTDCAVWNAADPGCNR